MHFSTLNIKVLLLAWVVKILENIIKLKQEIELEFAGEEDQTWGRTDNNVSNKYAIL